MAASNICLNISNHVTDPMCDVMYPDLRPLFIFFSSAHHQHLLSGVCLLRRKHVTQANFFFFLSFGIRILFPPPPPSPPPQSVCQSRYISTSLATAEFETECCFTSGRSTAESEAAAASFLSVRVIKIPWQQARLQIGSFQFS
jgi:hypothetical protein